MAELIADDLLEILVCLDDHAPLEELVDQSALRCTGCGLHYPVRDGIPWMLEEEAYRPGDDATES